MTISCCMIVKNEEKMLPACLASLQGIADEFIIVDTGSEDRTREIAASFGARVSEFTWIDDFAAARNYAFSLATGDYIYSADADEVIDEENRARFLELKKALAEGSIEADIVQMYYCGQLKQRTVYNFDRELRPKLFRRLRPFIWEDPVHEQVRLMPVVYDSEIEIGHFPQGEPGDHAARDLAIFSRMLREDRPLSSRLQGMYARELWMAGTAEDLAAAKPYFTLLAETSDNGDRVMEALLLCARAARLAGDHERFLETAVRILEQGKNSEICCEMAAYYEARGDAVEACVWNAMAGECEAVIDIRCSMQAGQQEQEEQEKETL